MLASASCNKDVPAPIPNTFPTPSGPTIADLLNSDTGFTIMRAAAVRAGIMPQLQDNAKTFTLFAPDNAAFAASGIRTVADIEAMPLSTLVPLVQYHLTPQKLTSSMIPAGKMSLQYPSAFNPFSSVSPLFRVPLFPSRANGLWVNHAPVKTADIQASNGMLFRLSGVMTTPTRTIWDRIDTDPDLSFLKAAVLRADSGFVAGSSSSLVGMLSKLGDELTLFAPTYKAFKEYTSGILYKYFVSMGNHPATALEMADQFSTPAFFSSNNSYIQNAKAIRDVLYYHVLIGDNRVFVNNFNIFPNAPAYKPTLFNTVMGNAPGLGVISQVNVPPYAATAQVKGVGNMTGNLLIDRAPEPRGSSDQNHLNGTIHKIDAVMRPY